MGQNVVSPKEMMLLCDLKGDTNKFLCRPKMIKSLIHSNPINRMGFLAIQETHCFSKLLIAVSDVEWFRSLTMLNSEKGNTRSR